MVTPGRMPQEVAPAQTRLDSRRQFNRQIDPLEKFVNELPHDKRESSGAHENQTE